MAGIGEGKRPNLPDLYFLFPEVIRQNDNELVNRPEIIQFRWDSGNTFWDQPGVKWDQKLGPEPILRTTIRAIQPELEAIGIDSQNFTQIFDPDTAPVEFLPYILSLYGQPLNTDLSEVSQRTFVRNFADFMRNKGTLLSFEAMFRSLGFDPDITELYQSKVDAQIVEGLKIEPTSTSFVSEVLDTAPGAVTQFGPLFTSNRPLIAQKVVIQAGTQIVVDDGSGGLIGDIGGGTNSVDYETGEIFVDFADPPAAATEIKVSFEYIIDPFPQDFTLTEQVATGDGTDTYLFELAFDRVEPGSVVITDPVTGQTVTDDGAGNLVGDVGAGNNTIDYETGEVDVTFAAVVGSGDPIFTAYTYEPRFRSSFFDAFIIPINPLMGFTPQTILRVLNLFFILKPIHSTPRKLALLIEFEDPLQPVDDPVFEENMLINSGIDAWNAGLFHGKPWELDYLNDLDQVPQIRDGRQTKNRFPAPLAPARTDTTVTADVVATTTFFSTPVFTTDALEDLVAFNDGVAKGLSSVITLLVNAGTHMEVTVSPALQKVPGTGDSVTILRGTARRNWLLNTEDAFDELEVEQIPVIPGPSTTIQLGTF